MMNSSPLSLPYLPTNVSLPQFDLPVLAQRVVDWLSQHRLEIDASAETAPALVEGVIHIDSSDDPIECRRKEIPINRLWRTVVYASDRLRISDADVIILFECTGEQEAIFESLILGRSYTMAIALRKGLKERIQQIQGMIGRQVSPLQPPGNAHPQMDGFTLSLESMQDGWALVLSYTVVLGSWGFWAFNETSGKRERSLDQIERVSRPSYVLPEGPKTSSRPYRR